MTDHNDNRCAVCGAEVRTHHEQQGPTEANGTVVIRTTRWCSADYRHNHGARGVVR